MEQTKTKINKVIDFLLTLEKIVQLLFQKFKLFQSFQIILNLEISPFFLSITGLFGPEAFANLGFAEVDANLMTNLANLGLAHSTHKVNQIAVNLIYKCENDKNVIFNFHGAQKRPFTTLIN